MSEAPLNEPSLHEASSTQPSSEQVSSDQPSSTQTRPLPVVNPPKPTLCIINYNGANILGTSLPPAAALAHRFEQILLLDNGSTDGSAEMAERDYPAITVTRLGKNLGAGGARNEGLRRSPTDLIVFIDNDVALTEGCVDHLVAAMESHPKAALAAAAVIYAHQRDMVQYDGAECHFLGIQTLLDEDVPLAKLDTTIRKVGSIVTCCFIADRRRLPPDEFFDESFFYMFEDHEWGVRVRMCGPEILSVPAAQCFHGKGTEGLSIRQLGSYSSKRVYYIVRNRWMVILKNFQLRTLILLAPLYLFYDFAQLLVALKKGWMREYWGAFTWMVGNFGTILSERRRIQAKRRVPDREVLYGGPIPFRAELTTSKAEKLARDVLNTVAKTYWKLARPFI